MTSSNGDTLFYQEGLNNGCNESFDIIGGVQGCLDPSANNYDSNAVCDDGSCCYGPPIVDVTQISWALDWSLDCQAPPENIFEDVILL